jgi:hypothetical protein
MVSKRWTWRELPFGRSFVGHSFVRRRGVNKMTKGGKKVMTRGRRSKNNARAEKRILQPGGVWKNKRFDGFQPENSVTNCPLFRNRDGKSTFKFHMERDEMYVYQGILDLSIPALYCVRELLHKAPKQRSVRKLKAAIYLNVLCINR